MPRYYLHLRDRVDEMLDLEGSDFADKAALERAVLFSARDVIAGDVRRGVIDLRFRIDAEDERGALIHSLPFVDAVEMVTINR